MILLASLILGFPLLRKGLPFAHDSEEHLERYACFVSQLSEGEIYPRWLTKLNAGFGSPVMFVYAPLAYYVPAALRPILPFRRDGLTETREFGVSVWIALALSGIAAFFWLGSFVNRPAVATLGAVLYMAMPYHLAIDIYTRAALAEIWSFVWMPLILYYASAATRTRSLADVSKLAVCYALLLYTHLLTALIFTPVLLAAACFLVEKGQRPSLCRIALALGLGIALSAAYLGPALQHERYVSPARLSQLRPALFYGNNFLTLLPGLLNPRGISVWLWKLSWIAITTLAAAAAAFALNRNPQSRERIFWLTVAVVSVVMMLPISHFLWAAFPPLAAIQFPFRFHMILTLATVALVAMAADSLRFSAGAGRIALTAVLAGILCFWGFSDLKAIVTFAPWRANAEQPLLSRSLTQDVLLGGWSQATDPRFLMPRGILALSQTAATTILGTGLKSASLERNTARALRLTEDGEKGWLTVPLLLYHGWVATTEDGHQRLPMRPGASGLVELEAPAGLNRIHLNMPRNWVETTSNATTVAAALLCAILLLTGRGRRRSA